MFDGKINVETDIKYWRERNTEMTEILFLIEDDPEGGFMARALRESIFTQADDLDTLRENIMDAVKCHFPDEAQRPKIVRLHQVRDEVIAL